jgi:hypothetical protein
MFLKRNNKRLRRRKFRIRFGSLYLDIKTKRRYSVLLSTMFLVRRLIFGIIIAQLNGYLFLQQMIHLLISLFYLIFLINIRPYDSFLSNILEIYNEITLLLCSFCCYIFSDFVTDIDSRYSAGWYFVSFASVNILINLVLISYNLISIIIRLLKLKCMKP